MKSSGTDSGDKQNLVKEIITEVTFNSSTIIGIKYACGNNDAI